MHVSPLKVEDIDGVVSCIQRAFADDPYFQWVFDRQTFSSARNAASLRSRCLWGMKYALFHVARDDDEPQRILGVACWLPPNLARTVTTPSWSQYMLSYLSYDSWTNWITERNSEWGLWLAQLSTNIGFRGRGGLCVRRYHIWKTAQAAAQQTLWDDPNGYYFCNIVAVIPEAQGKGVGKRLMNEVLRRADLEGRRCYLESSMDVPNVEIYRTMKFDLKREMRCEDRGEAITLYCMVREPQINCVASSRDET